MIVNYQVRFLSKGIKMPTCKSICYLYEIFFFYSRSMVTVMRNINDNNTNNIVRKFLALIIWKTYEVPKVIHILKALDIFKKYFPKFTQANKKIKKIFTLYNLSNMLMYYEFLRETHLQGKSSIYIDKLLSDPCFLLFALITLKNKLNYNWNISINNISIGSIVNLANKIKYNIYIPKPVHKFSVFTINGKKKSLSISSNTDKILQQAIILLIQDFFYTKFSPYSHGFIKGKSCHTALLDIYSRWLEVKWFIKFDLNACFDNTQHSLLLKEIYKITQSYKVNLIINKFLKKGFVYFGNMVDTIERNTEGTLEGCLLSPLLCNIYLTFFDNFVVNYLLKKYNKGKFSKNCTFGNPNLRVLKYVRYGNNFLMGFLGSKKEGWSILIESAHWLDINLGLKLVINQCNIKHYCQGVYFLGYVIWNKKALSKSKLRFSVPLNLLIKRFAERGFFQLAKWGKKKRYVGKRQNKWLFLKTDVEIVQQFNNVIRRVYKYYSGSTKKYVLKKFWFLMKKSCALTLAHKNSKKTSWWAFNKYGKDLIVKKNNFKIVKFVQLNFHKNSCWDIESKKGEISYMMAKISGISLPKPLTAICSIISLNCIIPGCDRKSDEWHYLKHYKKLKGYSIKHKNVILYTNQQIPVCKLHHKLIHLGKYDGPSLRKMKGYSPIDFKEDL